MEIQTLGDVAEYLTIGTTTVTKLMHLVSIVVGCSLFIMAISLFKANRANPKFVPLERPIIYVVLGVVLVALPFYGKLFFLTGGAHDLKTRETRKFESRTQDVDAPLDWGNDYDH